MTIKNISTLDQELYLLALQQLPTTFSFDDLLNEIHLSRPKFQRKTLRYRIKKLRNAKLLRKQGWGKSVKYTCLVDEPTFTTADFICTEKPIDLEKNPFIL